jgi:predicted transcriptional regulator
MVLKNRSRVEILYDIISAANPSSKKTHLMYKGNLSYQQLDLYLDFILKNGLMEERFSEDDGRLFFVTEKGLQFAKLFEDMCTLIRPSKSVDDKAKGIVSQQEIPASVASIDAAPPTQASFNY